jgi:hypothetical protein
MISLPQVPVGVETGRAPDRGGGAPRHGGAHHLVVDDVTVMPFDIEIADSPGGTGLSQ